MKSSSMIYHLTSLTIAISICKDALAFSTPKQSTTQVSTYTILPLTTPCKPTDTTLLYSSTNNEEEQITIDQYSRCLSPYEEKQSIKKETSQYSIIDPRPKWQSNLLKPINFTGRSLSKLGNSVTKVGSSIKRIVRSGNAKSSSKQPGQLILLRCGESEWTKNGRFTGWADVDLVDEGVLEIEHAAR